MVGCMRSHAAKSSSLMCSTAHIYIYVGHVPILLTIESMYCCLQQGVKDACGAEDH